MHKQVITTKGTTYFLETIAKGEELRYSEFSRVISCLEMLHCLSRNLTVRASRNTLSGIIVEFSTTPPLHQFPFTEKTGYWYNAFHESDSC